MTGCGVSWSNSVEFALHAADAASELHDSALHAEADAEEGDVALPAKPNGRDLALDAALAEAAGDDDAVDVGESVGDRCLGDLLGVDPAQVELPAVMEAGVFKRLPDREVGLVELHVLTHEADRHRALARVDALDEAAELA